MRQEGNESLGDLSLVCSTPVVSALLITYCHEEFIAQAIKAILSQSHLPDQLVISDDASTDRTLQVVEDCLKRADVPDSLEVLVRQNSQNLGFIPHLNQALACCNGELIVYCSGDDFSMPTRIEEIVELYRAQGSPQYFLAHSNVMTWNGQLRYERSPPVTDQNFSLFDLGRLAALHIGATQAFTKALFEDFGGIRYQQAYEDLVLGYRAALCGQFHYLPKPLITYRVGGLTSWTKNPYPLKRSRFKDVLAQRIHDCMLWNRTDLQLHLSNYFGQLGFTLNSQERPALAIRFSTRPNHQQAELNGCYLAEHLAYLRDIVALVDAPEKTASLLSWIQSYERDGCDTFLLAEPEHLSEDEFMDTLSVAEQAGYPLIVDLGASVFSLSDKKLATFKSTLMALDSLGDGARVCLLSQSLETIAALKKLTNLPSYLMGPMANCDRLVLNQRPEGYAANHEVLVVKIGDAGALPDEWHVDAATFTYWDILAADAADKPVWPASRTGPLWCSYDLILVANQPNSLNGALERILYFELLLSGVSFRYLHWPAGHYFDQDEHYTFAKRQVSETKHFELINGELEGFAPIQGQTAREFFLESVYLKSSIQKNHPQLLRLLKKAIGSNSEFYESILAL